MTYYNYLYKTFYLYIIFGVILAFAVFSVRTLHRYNNYMFETESQVNSIIINKSRIKSQTNEITGLTDYLKKEFSLDIETANSDVLTFEALDRMKEALGDALITVEAFQQTEGERALPVEIYGSVGDYGMILQYLDYVESLRLPKFNIGQLTIIKEETGKVMLKINGALAMPPIGVRAEASSRSLRRRRR